MNEADVEQHAAHRSSVVRVTFVIRAENQADALASIVLLFQNLNVEIEALYMVRRRSSETMRINVTIEANRQVGGCVEANVCELAKLRSVKVERAREKISSAPLDEESEERHQG